MSVPSLSDTLGSLSRRLLGEIRRAGGRWLALRVLDDGRLRFRLPAEGWREEAAPELQAAGVAVERIAGPAGDVVELDLDLGERAGELQRPEVLLALRAEAAAVPEVAFRVELPAGVRDVQRARAGLDSSRRR